MRAKLFQGLRLDGDEDTEPWWRCHGVRARWISGDRKDGLVATLGAIEEGSVKRGLARSRLAKSQGTAGHGCDRVGEVRPSVVHHGGDVAP